MHTQTTQKDIIFFILALPALGIGLAPVQTDKLRDDGSRILLPTPAQYILKLRLSREQSSK